MSIWIRVGLLLSFTCFLWPDHLVSQNSSSTQESSSATGERKESKKQGRKFAKEAGPAYDSWVRDEVPDIITEEERRAFRGLGTVERLMPVSFLAPGHYTLEVTAIDLLTNQTVVRSFDFRVIPARSKPASTAPVW